MRETASRVCRPVQRQWWLPGNDGESFINSSDNPGQSRSVPIYLLITDLAFSAMFSVCAKLTRLGLSGVVHFFMLYLPLVWLWMLINHRFNGFDAEDVVSEVVVVLVNVGQMGIALNFRQCFCELTPWLDVSSNNTVTEDCPSAEAEEYLWSNNCALIGVFYICVRLVITGLSLYIAYHVRRARTFAYRELLALTGCVPLMLVLLLLIGYSPEHDGLAVEIVWFFTMLFDMAVNLGTQVLLGACAGSSAEEDTKLGRCISRWDRMAKTLMLRVPVDLGYLEARNERMIVIALGNIVANEITGAHVSGTVFSHEALIVCVATPLVMFFCKVYYFDLSPALGSLPNEHAFRASVLRGGLWSVLHGPLIGCVLWLAVAMQGLVFPASDAQLAALSTTDARWNFVGAVCAFLAVCTGQHALHRGQGHAHRRVHKNGRMALRLVPAITIIGLAAGLDKSYRASFFWMTL